MPKLISVKATSTFEMTYLFSVPDDYTVQEIEDTLNSGANITDCKQEHLGEKIQAVVEISDHETKTHIDPMYSSWDTETVDNVLINKLEK